jgi:hypothetical protein
MGIWVNYAQAVLTLLTVAMTIVVAAWARSAAKDGKEARRLVETLAEAFRIGHGYSDPSGAAVVTEGAVESGEPSAATARRIEALDLPVPAVDTRGDRSGVNPPVSVRLAPGNMTEAERVQGRFYDMVARARVNVAHCGGSECTGGDSANTCPCPCDPCGTRRALFVHAQQEIAGQLRTVVAPGIASPEARERYSSHLTRPRTLEDSGPIDRLEARYAALCGAARLAGQVCDHCHGDECERGDAEMAAPVGIDPAAWHAIGGVDSCVCNCDGCHSALVIYRVAERDVYGAGVGVDDDPSDSDPPPVAA